MGSNARQQLRIGYDQLNSRLSGQTQDQQRWFINGQGQTMITFRGPIEFHYGFI